jgi:Uma2 family endonuclease
MTTAIAPQRTDWTKDEAAEYMERCHPDVRYELIDGEIVLDMPNPSHVYAVEETADWLRDVFGQRHVRQEVNITLRLADDTTNDLQPDCAVTRFPRSEYARRHPGPDDLLLVVEVSNTSLNDDMTKKRRLYAASGIREYWVLALTNRRLLVYRDPAGGDYPDPSVYGEDALVATLAAPEAAIRVGDLLPPLEEPAP